jgi:hypothetical protein
MASRLQREVLRRLSTRVVIPAPFEIDADQGQGKYGEVIEILVERKPAEKRFQADFSTGFFVEDPESFDEGPESDFFESVFDSDLVSDLVSEDDSLLESFESFDDSALASLASFLPARDIGWLARRSVE